MNDVQVDLQDEKSQFMKPIVQLLVLLLEKNQTINVISNVLKIAQHLLLKYRYPLFHFNDHASCLADFTFEILRMCNAKTDSIRIHATAILYQLIRVYQTNHFEIDWIV